MSWQGNNNLVFGIEHQREGFAERMVEAVRELLSAYDENGRGWYLLGNFRPDGSTEEDYDPFEPVSMYGGAPSCFCWMPNPFMQPAVLAVNVRNAEDMVDAAFECVDCCLDATNNNQKQK